MPCAGGAPGGRRLSESLWSRGCVLRLPELQWDPQESSFNWALPRGVSKSRDDRTPARAAGVRGPLVSQLSSRSCFRREGDSLPLGSPSQDQLTAHSDGEREREEEVGGHPGGPAVHPAQEPPAEPGGARAAGGLRQLAAAHQGRAHGRHPGYVRRAPPRAPALCGARGTAGDADRDMGTVPAVLWPSRASPGLLGAGHADSTGFVLPTDSDRIVVGLEEGLYVIEVTRDGERAHRGTCGGGGDTTGWGAVTPAEPHGPGEGQQPGTAVCSKVGVRQPPVLPRGGCRPRAQWLPLSKERGDPRPRPGGRPRGGGRAGA